jgi:leucyl/phenylalanyl-tRNA---protein transferase
MAVIDPDLLLRAYAVGVFPMSDSRAARDVYWVEPKRRAILPLDRFHLSRSLRKTLRSGRFRVTRDRAFAAVIRACAERTETWINPEIERSYVELHRLGHAHSVEVWSEGALVGGLYGVRIDAAFFGESMFSAATDASKVALAWLVARLKVGGFRLLDCQFMTDHLKSLGAVELPQSDYLQLLAAALEGSALFAGAAGSAGRGARGRRAGASPPASFEALDSLLPASSAGTEAAALLTQTSQIGCSTTLSDGDSR